MLLLLICFAFVSTEVLSAQVFVCEHNQQTISCPVGQVLHINGANYGRTSKSYCPNNGYDDNIQCRDKNTTAVVSLSCEGHQSCVVTASNSVFGDPCVGTYKYLEITYSCGSVNRDLVTREQITCYDNNVTISCPPLTVLSITSADFGRHSTTLCPYKGADQLTTCSLDETTKVRNMCNGLDKCTINVNAQNFPTDPCYGTYKYLDIKYTCPFQLDVAPRQRQQITCYDNTLLLTCPQFNVIQVVSADFGRRSTKICPYAGADTFTQCSLNETKKVAQSCNGLQTCKLPVDAKNFPTDPCYGTYKYLDVKYYCQVQPPAGRKEQITCWDKTLSLSCAPLDTIKVISADYGRRNTTICPYPGADQYTQCSLDETKKVSDRCNGLHSCDVKLNANIFPKDPCYGTYKYFDVKYNCERHLPTSEIRERTGCYENTVTLTCPAQKIIKVVVADYGRHSTSICPYPGADQFTQCSMDQTSSVANSCDGLHNCTIYIGANQFPTDPCYGTYKYLDVYFTCNEPTPVIPTNGCVSRKRRDTQRAVVSEEIREAIACTDKTLDIYCPTSQVIRVINANFGRTNALLCPLAGHDTNTQCYLTETVKMSQKCNGFGNCSISMDTTNFIDPCFGTFKYLDVNYTCEDQPPPGSMRQKIACAFTTFDIRCPASTIIDVVSVNFGRHNTKICPSPGADQYTECSLDEKPVVARRCNGYQNCTFNIDTTMFKVDPCYGTFKYLDVKYFCNPAPVERICGANEEYGCDNPCFRHCLPPTNCPNSCDQKCICKKDYKRDPNTGLCVSDQDCPQEGVIREAIGCTDKTLDMSCPTSQVIRVINANFGRTNALLCPLPGHDTNTQCYLTETVKMSQKCNGYGNCSISMDTTNFIDPCFGTFKYLDVNYTCENQPPPGSMKQKIACAFTTFDIRCPASTIIDVVSVNFGRHNTKICPSPGADQYTECSLDEKPAVARRCNGYQNCTFNVDTTMFKVDPCYGTFKYLDVKYFCNPAPVGIICGANEEYGCDNPCFRHCLPPTRCTNSCEKRCICTKDYKRDPNTGLCISDRYCPQEANCESHEVLSECNASCQPTCQHPRACCTGAACVSGYVCAANYVRNTATGECVRPADCPWH